MNSWVIDNVKVIPGFENFGTHDCRKTKLRLLLDSDWNISDVSEYARHTSIAMTGEYTAVGTTRILKKAVDERKARNNSQTVESIVQPQPVEESKSKKDIKKRDKKFKRK